MLLALQCDPKIGLAGPCSNCVSGGQQVPVRYEDLAGLDGFAWDWGKAHDGHCLDTDRLVGFCLLIRREVVDRIGLLDDGERYFSSVDRGLTGFKARQNLAVVYTDLGDLVRAEEQWRRVVEEVPSYRPGRWGLGEVLLRQGKYKQAHECLQLDRTST